MQIIAENTGPVRFSPALAGISAESAGLPMTGIVEVTDSTADQRSVKDATLAPRQQSKFVPIIPEIDASAAPREATFAVQTSGGPEPVRRRRLRSVQRATLFESKKLRPLDAHRPTKTETDMEARQFCRSSTE